MAQMEKINLGLGRGRYGRKQDPSFKPSLYQLKHEELVRQHIMKSQYRNVFIPKVVKNQDAVDEVKQQNSNMYLPDVGASENVFSKNGNEDFEQLVPMVAKDQGDAVVQVVEQVENQMNSNCLADGESGDFLSNNGNEEFEQLEFVPVPMVVKDQYVVNEVEAQTSNTILAEVDESDEFFSNIVNELCEQLILELEEEQEDVVDEVPIVEKDVAAEAEVEVKEEKPLSINCQADDCQEYFVNNGICEQGLNCDKRHTALALGSTSQCIGWTNGVCRLESSCVYRHARDSRVLKKQEHEPPTNGNLFAPPQTNMNTQNQILALKSKVNSKYVHASASLYPTGTGQVVFVPFIPPPINFYPTSSNRSRMNNFN